MFERYTEKARRVIFFARYEASNFGSPYIETEHLLLGILRENKALTSRILRSAALVESIRKAIEANTPAREKTSTSVDLPLSKEGKQVLAYAAEEAERLGHKHIGTEHLLLGLLREEGSFAAALLTERGVNLSGLREEFKNTPALESRMGESFGTVSGSKPSAGSVSLGDLGRDLTQAAVQGHLDPLVAREQELGAVVEILCRRYNRSAVLIGERGTGKSAIVEGLAQRIALGTAPPELTEVRVMAINGGVVADWVSGRNSEERLTQIVKALIDTEQILLFIDDLEQFIGAAATSRWAVLNGILKHWLLRGKLMCVGACTPAEYGQLIAAVPWIRECFSEVHVHPLDAEATRQLLESRKHGYESFHGVTYADDALDAAAGSADRYLPRRSLPGKALELLDAAGARVKLRQAALPDEITDTMKRINFNLQRMDSALANHEFEKARFYSDEERKERENLRGLGEKHHLEDVLPAVVTRRDVEEVIGLWSKYPFQA